MLKFATAGALGALAPLSACARGEVLETTELADSIVLIPGAGGNVVAVRGPDGAVLVDGGAAEFTDIIVRTATRATRTRDVAALFNTHWHPEQTGANERLGADGVPIIAHENTRLWLSTEINRRWDATVFPPRPASALPTETIYTTGSLSFGDEQADYGYMLQAHTDGDIYVFFREANVLAAGGVVSNAGWPAVDWTTGGWIGGLVEGYQTLIDLADETTVVAPADGPPMTRADLVRHHEMYTVVRDRLRRAWESSHGIEEVLTQALTAEYDDEMGDPTLFLTLAYKSWWGHVRELSVV